VARDSSGDVTRAMAVLAASSIPYRSFAETATGAARPDQATRVAGDFPLLMAALPEVARLPMPPAPVAPALVPISPKHIPAATALEPTKADATGVDTRVHPTEPARSNAQSFERTPGSDRFRQFENDTVSLSARPPVRHAAALGFPKQRPAPPPLASINTERTPLGGVFRTLLAAEPNVEKPHEAPSGLQNMFSLL
jgi:hypothetical protein